jgi:hypothetical protein
MSVSPPPPSWWVEHCPPKCDHSDGRFICQIDDHGTGVKDPLAGYATPDPIALGGRGCWLARQLIDLLQITPTGSGTSVRLHAVARAGG